MLGKSGGDFSRQIDSLNMEVQNCYKEVQLLKAEFAEMKLEVKAMLKEIKQFINIVSDLKVRLIFLLKMNVKCCYILNYC